MKEIRWCVSGNHRKFSCHPMYKRVMKMYSPKSCLPHTSYWEILRMSVVKLHKHLLWFLLENQNLMLLNIHGFHWHFGYGWDFCIRKHKVSSNSTLQYKSVIHSRANIYMRHLKIINRSRQENIVCFWLCKLAFKSYALMVHWKTQFLYIAVVFSPNASLNELAI